jgi:thioesterase DpgC
MVTVPELTSNFASDRYRFGVFWRECHDVAAARVARSRFLSAHASSVYDALTEARAHFIRLEELCRRASVVFPGLLPTEDQLAAEATRGQRDKAGLETDQGIFLSHVLAEPAAGMHLCHAMLLPREDSLAHLPAYEKKGEIEFPGAHLRREGKASVLTMRNPRYLNAEDNSTLGGMEMAVDLALLDPHTEVCVLRGGVVEHPKYAGQRVFGAGINLSRLYEGKIPFLWYLVRDLGFVNKLYRGLAYPKASPEQDSREKLWIAAVEGFAIGGHCQILLTMDYTLAAQDAYLTLPARKEGIVPGAANLRLARFVGDRIARQAVMAERRLQCASPEGRMICDAIVPARKMDAAIAETVERLTDSGVVSAAGNRRAFRIGQEPLDTFRRYMAVYAREQAHCHFSPALIANLERNWVNGSRKPAARKPEPKKPASGKRVPEVPKAARSGANTKTSRSKTRSTPAPRTGRPPRQSRSTRAR